METKKNIGETVLYCIVCIATFGVAYGLRLVISESIRRSLE